MKTVGYITHSRGECIGYQSTCNKHENYKKQIRYKNNTLTTLKNRHFAACNFVIPIVISFDIATFFIKAVKCAYCRKYDNSRRGPKAKNPAEAGLCEKVKLTDKPGSVVDSHSSRPAIAHWLKQPTRVQYGPYLVNPYLALLRVEFTVPRTVTSRAVRSYRTLSPLPDPACAGHRRFALCCTGRGFPPQALPGTLPYGARTFLPSARLPRRGRRRSGDCLVSFGAQYRGFARPCHPALRIPIASVAAILREARQILS